MCVAAGASALPCVNTVVSADVQRKEDRILDWLHTLRFGAEAAKREGIHAGRTCVVVVSMIGSCTGHMTDASDYPAHCS